MKKIYLGIIISSIFAVCANAAPLQGSHSSSDGMFETFLTPGSTSSTTPGNFDNNNGVTVCCRGITKGSPKYSMVVSFTGAGVPVPDLVLTNTTQSCTANGAIEPSLIPSTSLYKITITASNKLKSKFVTPLSTFITCNWKQEN